MIIQRLLLISSLIVSLPLLAEDVSCKKEFDVLQRTKKDKYEFVKKEIVDLNCNKSFDGKYFKIVHGIEETPISFEHEDKELVKKAANVYYHLTLARTFWIDEIKSEHVKSLKQLTIRLDITNAYSRTRHFKNEELEENFNNAWSTPEGQTPRFVKDKKQWGKEIWFSPLKKINARNKVKSVGNNPIHESLVLIKEPIEEFNKGGLLYQGLGYIASPELGDSAYMVSALQKVGTIALLYGLTHVTKYLDKWFVDKYYFIDTALVPDIIYHEYAHIALSDTMKTVHSVPVIEGMADYFAARMVKEKHLYEKLKKISSNRSKNRKSKTFYHPYMEQAWNANSEFTLSLLWFVRMEMEKVNQVRVQRGRTALVDVDQLIYEAHVHLDEESNILKDLTTSLLSACKKVCKSKRLGLNALHAVFEKKGL